MATRKIFGRFVLFCVFCITQVLSQECTSPLDMADRSDSKIKDSQITTSSVLRDAYGWQARLRQNIPKWGAWCPDVNGGSETERNYDQYIQIDLLKLTKITGIATQGRQGLANVGNEYVKDYKISYSNYSHNWIFYREKDQAANETKILRGNSNVYAVVRHNLDPTIIAKYIRVHPGYDPSNQACMRLELYGCVVEVILSYLMPVGQKTKNGKVNYNDTTYNGVIFNDFYKNGTGILTDGKSGPVEAKSLKGKGWVGWNNTKSQHIDIIFEFSGVRKFKDVSLTVNVDKKRSNAMFNRSQIFFASTKDVFSDTSFLQNCPKGFQPQDNPYNANVTLSLCENTARFIKLRLYFGGIWLLISEISFNSVPVSGSVKTSLQKCSRDTCIVTQSSTTSSPIISLTGSPNPTCTDCPTPKAGDSTAGSASPNALNILGRSTNSIGVFVGVAVTLAIVLVHVLVVLVLLYKRRRQASKLSSSVLAVETVEMQNQSPAEPSQDNQDEDYETPIDGGTTTYEEVEISPSSVYTALNMNQHNGRGATNDSTYQKLLKHDSGYEYPTAEAGTAPYEYIQNSPPSTYTEPDTNQQDDTANDSDYVIPAEGHGGIEAYEEVGKKETPPGYTELDTSQQEDTANDHAYQKLLQYDSDYVIPAEGHGQIDPYEEVGKEKTPPGYTELDATKRQEDNAGYQKLIRE